ncbi:tripartite motif-containing protein 3-like [Patiria miniata]|uniref:Uncharacterized protein n=1 Tax=Patiria miniata TaxID=46514 RepID=A0A914AM62_PATMI|nr:tripartite motif-containing protein 3-like [Patiria miniata]
MATAPKNTSKWEMCCVFGKEGRGPGEFGNAHGIAATQSGQIAVADSSNFKVMIYSNEGQYKEDILLQSRPWDVATFHNHDNRLVVVDSTQYVKMFKDNKLLFQFPTVPQSEVDDTQVGLCSVAVRKNGAILVGDVERLVWTEHNPTNGEILRTRPLHTAPHYLTVDDATDRVVACDHGLDIQEVYVCKRKGTPLFTIKPTINGKPVQHCTGVFCDTSGIYIAVRNEHRTGHIHHYDVDGIFLDCLVQGLFDPRGITFTSNGQLAVAEWNAIKMYHKAAL